MSENVFLKGASILTNKLIEEFPEKHEMKDQIHEEVINYLNIYSEKIVNHEAKNIEEIFDINESLFWEIYPDTNLANLLEEELEDSNIEEDLPPEESLWNIYNASLFSNGRINVDRIMYMIDDSRNGRNEYLQSLSEEEKVKELLKSNDLNKAYQKFKNLTPEEREQERKIVDQKIKEKMGILKESLESYNELIDDHKTIIIQEVITNYLKAVYQTIIHYNIKSNNIFEP